MDKIDRASEIMKVISDRNRFRILCLLLHNEKSTSDIAQELNLDISLVSSHLRVLRDLHIVSKRKEGRNSFYTVSDDYVRDLVKFCLR